MPSSGGIFSRTTGRGAIRACARSVAPANFSIKLGKFGAFIGCSDYPNCRYTRPFALEGDREETATADAPLGTDPQSGLVVTLKKGPYGHYVQLGTDNSELKPKRVALPRSMKPVDVDLDTALRLLALPRELGRHPETGEAILASIGRFGPYIKHGTTFKSLAPDDDVLTIGVNRAVVLFAEPAAQRRSGPRLLRELGEHPEGGAVAVYAGRYGPYVSHDGVIASLPRTANPDIFSLDQAVPLLAAQREKGKGRRRKSGKSAAAPAKPPRVKKPAGTTPRATAGAAKRTGARKPRSRSSAQPS